MSRRETKERDILYKACRDKRQIKMESSARHKAWALLQKKIAKAEEELAALQQDYAANPTNENRRKALAQRMTLEALKQRAAKNWT